jgi:hypothetical protein
VAREIGFVADRVFPITALPQSARLVRLLRLFDRSA